MPTPEMVRRGEYATRGDYHRTLDPSWDYYPTYLAKLDAVRRYLFPDRRLIILSRDAESPPEVAQLLTDEGYGDSVITVLGDLDSETESRTAAVARDWIDHHAPALNVICVACVGATGRGASLAPGLPDEAFDHDGQLTKRDLRASALAHLMPRPGELLWDVGAGAASIAIEWLRTDPRCRAIAIERNLERVKRIRGNAEALGVPGLTVLHGAAPGALVSLPRPHAVFIGGDGWQGVVADTAASSGAYVGTSFNSEDPSPEVQRFVRAFRARYDTKPDAFAALAYDATKLVAEALAKKGTSREAVRDYLRSLSATSPFEGVTGPVYFNDAGDPIGMGFHVAQVVSGTLVSGGARVAMTPAPTTETGQP